MNMDDENIGSIDNEIHVADDVDFEEVMRVEDMLISFSMDPGQEFTVYVEGCSFDSDDVEVAFYQTLCSYEIPTLVLRDMFLDGPVSKILHDALIAGRTRELLMLNVSTDSRGIKALEEGVTMSSGLTRLTIEDDGGLGVRLASGLTWRPFNLEELTLVFLDLDDTTLAHLVPWLCRRVKSLTFEAADGEETKFVKYLFDVAKSCGIDSSLLDITITIPHNNDILKIRRESTASDWKLGAHMYIDNMDELVFTHLKGADGLPIESIELHGTGDHEDGKFVQRLIRSLVEGKLNRVKDLKLAGDFSEESKTVVKEIIKRRNAHIAAVSVKYHKRLGIRAPISMLPKDHFREVQTMLGDD